VFDLWIFLNLSFERPAKMHPLCSRYLFDTNTNPITNSVKDMFFYVDCL